MQQRGDVPVTAVLALTPAAPDPGDFDVIVGGVVSGDATACVLATASMNAVLSPPAASRPWNAMVCDPAATVTPSAHQRRPWPL